MTLGPVAFEIMTQIVPALGCRMAFILNALVTFAIGVTFLVIVDSRIGVAGAFYFYAGLAILAMIHCLLELDRIIAYVNIKKIRYQTSTVGRSSLEELKNDEIPPFQESKDVQITSISGSEVSIENHPPAPQAATAITIASLNDNKIDSKL